MNIKLSLSVAQAFSIVFCLVTLSGAAAAQQADLEAKTSSLRAMIESERSVPQRVLLDRTELPPCALWCDPASPDYRCLQVGGLDEVGEEHVEAVLELFSQEQPYTVTHSELLVAVDLDDQGFEDARESTSVEDGLMSNTGQNSMLSVQSASASKVTISVPDTVEYSLNSADGQLSLDALEATESFYLHISDPILNSTYGGTIQKVNVSDTGVILFMDSACISYDPRPQTYTDLIAMGANTLLDRLAAEQEVGSSMDRLIQVTQSYSSFSALRTGLCIAETCDVECGVNEVACKIDGSWTCTTVGGCDAAGAESCWD